jgi:hypothetical protein
MRGVPLEEVPSGAEHFMTQEAARLHAFGGSTSPDAVSATISTKGLPTSAGYFIVYDVPIRVFELLPIGDPLLGERVFLYSIPEAFRIGVVKP